MPLPYGWARLAAFAGGRLLAPGASPAGHFVVDSRSVQPGDVFVALPGERRDGHEFLDDVFQRGASGCLVSRAPASCPEGVAVIQVPDTLQALHALARAHRDRCDARVIAVTGSNGKTTTKDMLAHILRAAGKRLLFTRGNLNSRIGLPLMLLELERGHTHAVLEMGASARGDIAALAALARPGVGIVTGIGRAHLEFFGDLDGVTAAKWELVDALPRDGVAFLNADDPRLMARRALAQCPVVTFGRAPAADVRAENLRAEPETVFDLVVAGARREVRLAGVGLFNVSNALAAAAVAFWERVPVPTIVTALETFTPPAGRMEVRRLPDGTRFVLDAYNANPDSMAASLRDFVKAYPERPRYAVVGSMLELGAHAEPEHRALGALLSTTPLQAAFFTGPEGDWVAAGHRAGGGASPLTVLRDRDELRRTLARRVEPGAAVLFKGSRGARLEEIYEPLLTTLGKA